MTILYIFLAVIVGWFIGFLDSNLRTSKKIEAAEMKMKEAEKKIAEAEQNSQSTLQDDPGLLRLKINDGRFTLEVDGTLVPREISPDRKKRLIELVTILRQWLDSGQSVPVASQPAAPVQVQPAPDPVQVVVPVPVASPLQPLLQPLFPPKKPEPEKDIKSLSIVQQIDTVLQARLADTALAKRGVRLQESIQGGVEVYVGLNKFHAVDDVPDEEIKAAIRAAIAEWEKKYTPGL
jgi:hypothetical protein